MDHHNDQDRAGGEHHNKPSDEVRLVHLSLKLMSHESDLSISWFSVTLLELENVHKLYVHFHIPRNYVILSKNRNYDTIC